MQAVTRTRKIGGSLVVTIPKEIVKEESIEEGELLEVDFKKRKFNGFGALKGIGRFTRKERKEMWRERLE